MNGAIDYLPVMADCERALGRPERALALAKSPSVAKLPMAQQVEMTIVEAGARFDLGEVDSALRTLENAPVRSVAREDWVVRLRYAYADLLLQAGRRDEAIEWFHRTAGIDGGAITDAAERILELEGVTVEDTQSDDDDDSHLPDPPSGPLVVHRRPIRSALPWPPGTRRLLSSRRAMLLSGGRR